MRVAPIIIVSLLACVAPSAGQRTAAPDGRSVAEQIRDRDQGRDARFDVRMRLIDRQGAARERRFTMMLLRGRQREDRVLLRFTQPTDIKGTGLLVWKHAATESERFLFLPALGRVRRVAGGEAQESFVGSDFSYEDIGGQDLDAYTYDLVDANASAAGADGVTYQSYKLLARAKDPRAPYPVTVSQVDKATFIVRHAELLDRAGERRKTYDVRKLAKVQGFWTALEATMATERERTRTELMVETPEYNVGLTDDDFSRRTLERSGS